MRAVREFATQLKSSEGDTAKVALDRGLVTAIETRPAVERILKGVVGEDDSTHSFNQVSVREYLQATRAEPVLGKHSDNKVECLPSTGSARVEPVLGKHSDNKVAIVTLLSECLPST